ncbi:helix-turn-helix domain-containing protein [Aquimarina hainanensis]
MELRIKEICKEKGLKLPDLAKRLGISRQALSKRINNNPTIESLSEIAEILKVDPIELIVPSSDYSHFYSGDEWLGIRRK